MKRAASTSMVLGGAAAVGSIALMLSGWLEFLAPVVIAATFTFLVAWLNRGLVAPEEGRSALYAGVALAVSGTLVGLGVLALEVTSR